MTAEQLQALEAELQQRGYRTDFTANWEPIADIGTFERMAREFNIMVRRHIPRHQ